MARKANTSQKLPKSNNTNTGPVDRISDLPDNLREQILECLPLYDAIKTSELSRRWKRTWTRMQILKFDDLFFQNMGIVFDHRFTRIIERILCAHQGTLKKMTVNIPEYLWGPIFMNGWFMSLVKKELQQFEIYYPSTSYPQCHMPSYFFDCGRLTRLSLDICKLNLLPDFQGFPYLTYCCLYHVDATSNELAEFISKCPRIEELILIDELSFFSEPLQITAPNLITLHFRDYISGMINLMNAPSLTNVSLEVLGSEIQHNWTYSSFQLLSSLSRIEELYFDLPLLEPFDGACPNNLGNGFVSLRTLTLGQVNIYRPAETSFLFCLIRSSPNLKTLDISMYYTRTSDMEDRDSLECLEAEERKGYDLSKLMKVKISGITGLKCETKLVKIMLSNCPVLNTLHVEASWESNIEAELDMSWELNQCRRLSRDVEFVYSKSLIDD